jgi:HAD superfamily hydrolase (TIGR01549 family)
MVRAVVFDIDGTLVDSVALHAEAWRLAFEHFGVHVTQHDVAKQIGKGGDQLMPVFLSREQLERFGEELTAYRAQLWKTQFLSRVRAFSGVRALATRLRDSGTKVVLASSAHGDEIETYKRVADIADLVESQTSADDADRSKPHPDIFVAALEKAGISARDAVVVGDSPYDAEAAAKIGLRTIGVLSGGFGEGELRAAGCAALYRDVADLLEHFDESPLAHA